MLQIRTAQMNILDTMDANPGRSRSVGSGASRDLCDNRSAKTLWGSSE